MNPVSSRFRISISTWNVHGLAPDKHSDLERWLLDAPAEELDRRGLPNPPIDIFVIGLQEVMPHVRKLSKHLTKDTEELSDRWTNKLQETISMVGDYALPSLEYMWGIHVFVFVKRDIGSLHMKDTSKNQLSTGIADMFGLKGGVGISLNAFGRKMCFVCCHLEAGGGVVQCKERNDDMKTIMGKLDFSKGGSISDHDMAFVFGDLNYRISGDQSAKKNKKALKEQGIMSLLSRDELLDKQLCGDPFNGYEEMPVTFLPTYKCKLNSDGYERYEDLAWTDRVLWRVQGPDLEAGQLDPLAADKLLPLAYGRAELKSSDHKPVFALFDVLSPEGGPDFSSLMSGVRNATSVGHILPGQAGNVSEEGVKSPQPIAGTEFLVNHKTGQEHRRQEEAIQTVTINRTRDAPKAENKLYPKLEQLEQPQPPNGGVQNGQSGSQNHQMHVVNRKN